jgi:hypothetical protein
MAHRRPLDADALLETVRVPDHAGDAWPRRAARARCGSRCWAPPSATPRTQAIRSPASAFPRAAPVGTLPPRSPG